MRRHLAHEARQRFAGELAERHPARAIRRSGIRRHGCDMDGELQREMRERMRDHAGKPAPSGTVSRRGDLRRRRERRLGDEIVGPVAGRDLGIPPSRPCAGRVRSRTYPSARTATNAAPRRSRPSVLGVLRGNRAGSPPRRAAQRSVHGHRMQAGCFGVQMVAPRSIRACAKSPARRAGVSPSARRRNRGLACGSGSSTA